MTARLARRPGLVNAIFTAPVDREAPQMGVEPLSSRERVEQSRSGAISLPVGLARCACYAALPVANPPARLPAPPMNIDIVRFGHSARP